ncbi:hypothetical protein [Photorhabdus tasmaniensis]|uniref:Uncharacterized protein n=1 Tax=Photorhabdus tasmaniensis TaxID=1004159 RepID=A0ABX0GCH0_9GAMM|nr:hypothetical protein [Photorhabdus tasmaniensis]NHB86202.1 hypothetical protein [Photorhabdus tasmaniensis]
MVIKKKYVPQRKAEPEKVKQYLNKRIEFFLKKHNIDKNNRVEVRTAKRFALTYAAGALAIKYKVLPFTKKAVMNGISRCYLDAMAYLNKVETKHSSDNICIPDELLKLLSLGDVFDLDEENSLNSGEINQLSVFKKKIDSVEMLAVKSDILKGIEPDRQKRNLLLEYLATQGILLRDADGKNTRAVRKGVGRRYCFVKKDI